MVVAAPLSATNYSLGHASRTVILVLESLKKTRDDDRDRDRLGNRVVGERETAPVFILEAFGRSDAEAPHDVALGFC
ncbi:hypothetical protein AK812_SmicGene17270 [Symbiodinium microadriaticum]|uniref:Uncharacterized protein n=1 Tax=Symbiodinium microadriaticum TaxID=2951 RepID=A0A1Q9DY56_SYMMI|nr:hypothetical protein AK812_SmicGene17270 [Symbiodinium microadriaticum]